MRPLGPLPGTRHLMAVLIPSQVAVCKGHWLGRPKKKATRREMCCSSNYALQDLKLGRRVPVPDSGGSRIFQEFGLD